MKKRLVAFLLVLIMVLGMLPVSAMAAGSVVTARGSAENPIRIYENSGNQAETSNGSVQVPVGETVTDSGVLTFSTYSAIEGVQVSKGGVYCAVTSSNENVVKATGSWSGGVLTINFLGVGNGTAKITVDYTCTCSKNAVANGLLIYNVTVGDGGSTDPSGKPNAPTASDIGAFPDAGKAVLLHCVDAGARGHDATASSLNKVQNGYSVGEVVENPGTYYNVDGGKITKEQFPWMCVVTVHAAPFIELYNSNFSERYGVHKLAGTSNATATLHWFWHNTYGWQYLENPPIQFNITRDTSEKTYTLNYYKNTTDTVTNMPEPNPQTEKSNTGMVTFTVSSAILAREGYNFLGWNGNPNDTTVTVRGGNTITTPRETTNLYAVWESKTPPTDKPAKPTENDVTGVIVDIVCVTTTGTHDTVQYPLGHPTDAQHTIGEVVSDGAGGYICPVTVRTAWFVQQASNLVWKVQHTPTAQTITFNLTYDKNSKTWVKPAANPRIEATHEVTPPRKPALNEGSPVCVQCEKTNSIHVQNGKDYARMYFGVSDSTRYTEVLKDGKNVWKDDNGVWTYQIKLKKDKYIEAFNTTPLINSEHTDLYPDQDAYVTWKRDGNQWKIVPVSPNQSGIGAVINVTCKLKAPTADELKKLDMAVQVKCVVDAAQQHTSAYGLLGEYDKDYFVGEPKKVGDDWLCDISYDPDPYVAAFNKAFPTPKHIQNDEKIVPVTLIWVGGSWQIKTQGRVHVTEEYTVTYTDGVDGEEVFADQVYSDLRKDSTTPAFNGTPTRTGYTFAGWEPEVAATVTQTVTYVAKWEAKKANVHLMIFKSGDLSKPIVDVPYAADKLAGDTIDLTKIDPSSYLDFDFEIDGGWYDDGMFNSYKRYLDGLQDKPAGLEKLLITGNWQNLKLIVTELVPVVYFDSLESLTAYQNDHSKTEGILRTTKARVGSALPTADAPTATRDGYTFTFWSREGQTTDVTGQTVNGWTNLVANWKVTPHNIYAYARLNSYFAPLTTSEFDTPVTLNAATLSRLGLGSYNSLGYISIGSFTFDAMPLTSDLYFGDDAELSAVAEKLATDIALETGVSDKIVEKIAWTALYKTVNEEDMEPGYPAEAGYQLSGNLNLASVTFRAGAENVENMPAVNYTYDDGAIDFYDFYFAGDTITLPTTEPTREGYSFKGWSVEVIPAENDADHLDADGADDAADETLLKAGDTYTITKGGVIFTAQWKLNTYIIASDLRINSDTANLADGKTYAWTHRYGGNYGETIDYQPMFDALKARALAVDAANEPYDAEIKLCFPGNKNKLFNETILTYGQEGGGWNPGVKNTAYIWGYATTSYEVIFNSDGGSAVDTQIVKYGEKVVKPEDPTMKGYNFLGWFDKDGNPFDFDTEITHKTELKAQWEKKDYIIASDLRINGDTANLADGKDYPWTHRYGGKYEETIDYQPMFDALKARALEVDKANEPNPTKVDVELRFPGSSNLFNETILTYGQDGANWQAANNTAYIWGYAWTYYDVTFVTPEGATTVDAQLIKNGDCAAKPADPTKEGWKFLGWYADAAFKTEFNFDAPITKKTSVYAKFELTSTPIGDIYVRYDVLHIKQLPDGTYDLANAEVEHLSAKKDTTVTAVIKDYRATHHVNVNRTLSKLTGTAIQPYMGVDGKPVYTILSVYYDLDFHTLTFDTMGGSKIAPETVRHGLTVAKPKDPVNGGYIFDGWYTDKTFRHRYDFSTPLTEDITIYAKWFLIVLPGTTVKKTAPKLNTSDHFAYVQGYPDGTVKPAGNITRAETAAILFRLMDDASRKTYYSTKSGFRDVASGSWYNTYVATLSNAGVITDSSNGYFRPNEAITRAELAAMLAKFSETTGAANYFNDVSAKYWAANAIAICAKLGWITGYPDGTFRPDKNVTRAELMAMINRATGRAPKSADAFLPGMKTWIDNTSDKWYYLDVQEATNSHSYTVKGSETWTALTSDPNWSLYE